MGLISSHRFLAKQLQCFSLFWMLILISANISFIPSIFSSTATLSSANLSYIFYNLAASFSLKVMSL